MSSLLVLYASIGCANSFYVFVDDRSPDLARFTSPALDVLYRWKAGSVSEWSYPSCKHCVLSDTVRDRLPHASFDVSLHQTPILMSLSVIFLIPRTLMSRASILLQDWCNVPARIRAAVIGAAAEV